MAVEIYIGEYQTEVALVLNAALTQAGYEVKILQDGNSLIGELRKKLPQLMLLEVLLPGIRGDEICFKLKQKEAFKNIPIILMNTLSKRKSAKTEILDAIKATDYIETPIDCLEMLHIIERHLPANEVRKAHDHKQIEDSQEKIRKYLIDISKIHFFRLLNVLYFFRFSGSFEIYTEKLKRTIYFQQGSLYLAGSNSPDWSVRKILVESGRWDPQAIESVYQSLKIKSDEALATALLQSQLVTQADLVKAFAKQLKEIFLSLVDKGAGKFRLVPGSKPISFLPFESISPAFFILEGINRAYDFERVLQELRDAGRVLTKTANPYFDIRDLNLNESQLRLFSLINSERSIDDLMNYGILGKLDTCRLLYALLLMRFIRFSKKERDDGGESTEFRLHVPGQSAGVSSLESAATIRITRDDPRPHATTQRLKKPVAEVPASDPAEKSFFTDRRARKHPGGGSLAVVEPYELSDLLLSNEPDAVKIHIRQQLRRVSTANYYEILELGWQASQEEIRQAYKRLAIKYDPSRFTASHFDDIRDDISKILAKLMDAYKFLINDQRRAEYDQILAMEQPVRERESYPLLSEVEDDDEKLNMSLSEAEKERAFDTAEFYYHRLHMLRKVKIWGISICILLAIAIGGYFIVTSTQRQEAEAKQEEKAKKDKLANAPEVRPTFQSVEKYYQRARKILDQPNLSMEDLMMAEGALESAHEVDSENEKINQAIQETQDLMTELKGILERRNAQGKSGSGDVPPAPPASPTGVAAKTPPVAPKNGVPSEKLQAESSEEKQKMAREWLQKAQAAEGDPKKRLEYYQTALKFAPNLSPAQLGLAREYAYIGKEKQAKALFRDVIMNSQKSPQEATADEAAEAYFQMGLLAYKNGEKSQALKEMRKSLINNENRDVRYRLAETLFELKSYDEAVSMIQPLLDLPDLTSAEKEKYQQRLDWYQRKLAVNQKTPPAKAVAALPSNPPPVTPPVPVKKNPVPAVPEEPSPKNQAMLDKNSARELFKQAIETADMNQKISLFEQAIQKDPELIEAYYNLGYSYATKRQTDKAIQAYSRALDINPEFTKANYSLGAIYFNQKNYDQALRHFQKVASKETNYAMIHHTIAKVFILKKKYPEAMQELQTQLKTSTDPKEQETCKTLINKLTPYLEKPPSSATDSE